MLMTAHQNQNALGRASRGDDQNQDQEQMQLSVPPSPTLTNPDMILPWDDNERQQSTPSPPFNLPSLESLANMHSSYGGQYLQREANQDAGANNSQIGVAISVPARPEKRVFPRNMWLYEGHEPGRPLSEIGEEDDASPPPSRGREGPHLTVPYSTSSSRSSSATARDERSESRSSGSSSTVSAGSHAQQWNRGVQSVQTLQNSEINGSGSHHIQQDNGEGAGYGGTGLKIDEEVNDDGSSAILTNEAERILENAKRRLSLMEGNLSRARTSMRINTPVMSSPSPSPMTAPLPIGSHEPGGLYRSISRTEPRASLLRPRPTYDASQDWTGNWHSRVQSETNLPLHMKASRSDKEQRGLPRSLSAMATSSTSGHQDENDSFSHGESRGQLNHRASTTAFYPKTLNALTEEPKSASAQTPGRESPRGLGISEDKEEGSRITSMEEFNSAYPSEGPPSRAQSQLQVRDLKDQMTGLKIKISSLKVKTQEDNLRRRSLQSLRTPSPLTSAEKWITNSMELRDANGDFELNGTHVQSWRNSGISQYELQQDNRNDSDRSGTTIDGHDFQPEYIEQTDYDDQQSIIESHYEDAEEGDYDESSEIDREALNEILNEPLDDDLASVYEDFPDTTPHEEREDAFDYENFFLHSALGNYSRSRMRRGSNGSQASVETTRPAPSGQSVRHSRTNSGDSISTVATFATATEGDGAYDEESQDEINNALYWDRKATEGLPTPDYSQASRIYGYNSSDSGYPDDNLGTPRANNFRSNLLDEPSRAHVSSYRYSQNTNSPFSSPRDVAGSTTPTSAFVSSLVAASSPNPNTATPASSSLNNDDLRLLDQLFESLGRVCTDLQTIIDSPDPDPKTARLLRRRLDAARRVLDGELDT
ncbi:conserved hypothetical protein [Paecilomyces variotii No. 5]|uniref:Uncharacterized protein n=1 Tax=Byssochlamys spectabilis (strain No. 5 / NBRC 109023) TaxID=1356009 RepID=V5FWY2_BYSSN|nr:conserved hypothetical protein [Paecilomyces variotii No. 5]